MGVGWLQQPSELCRDIEETNALTSREAEYGAVVMALSNVQHQNDLVCSLVILQMFHQATHRSSHFGMAVPSRLFSPQIEVLRDRPDILQSLCWNLVLVANEDLWEFRLDVCIMSHERKEGHICL